jgi:B-box zinc finger
MEHTATTCGNHPGQPWVLFCLDDRAKLCLKCVAKHAGHTILDFEDLCVQQIQPELEEQAESARLRVEHLAREVELVEKQGLQLEQDFNGCKAQWTLIVNEICLKVSEQAGE